MASSRLRPTLADYVAIAIGPALIIVLVGSLAFFLLAVFYSGEFQARMFWTTSCFVFAAVLISRVSIVEGAERASFFGLALGAASALAMMRFTDHPWWAWSVLGVIWWSASHLVWNCTLIDDEQDASGEGLLEAAGFDEAAPPQKIPLPAQHVTRKKSANVASSTAPPKAPPAAIPLWRTFFAWWQRSASRTAPPGLTVVYFSLAALPIFGIGQYFIGEEDRPYAFRLMVQYVGSALGLLLTTSFLGLRRYLRQRNLEMPAPMAGTWLGMGGALAVVILILAMLIPRPNPEYAISSLTGTLGSPQREASSQAVMHDSPASGESSSTAPANEQTTAPPPEQPNSPPSENSASTPADAKGQQGAPSNDAKQQANTASQQSEQQLNQPQQDQTASDAGNRGSGKDDESSREKRTPQNKPADSAQQKQPQSDEQSGTKQERSDKEKNDDQNDPSQQPSNKQEPNSGKQPGQQDRQPKPREGQQKEQNPSPQSRQTISPPQTPPRVSVPKLPTGNSFAGLLRMAIYVALALAAVYCCVRYWAQLRSFLAGLWRELVSFWQSLFGGRPSPTGAAASDGQTGVTRRTFASYPDPFATGEARRHRPNVVVQYSFEALEAWAADRAAPRLSDETPLEFAARLGDAFPEIGPGARDLASLYARVAYARENLGPESLTSVQQLWGRLHASATRASASPAR